jgi:hypothetical protein
MTDDRCPDHEDGRSGIHNRQLRSSGRAHSSFLTWPRLVSGWVRGLTVLMVNKLNLLMTNVYVPIDVAVSIDAYVPIRVDVPIGVYVPIDIDVSVGVDLPVDLDVPIGVDVSVNVIVSVDVGVPVDVVVSVDVAVFTVVILVAVTVSVMALAVS